MPNLALLLLPHLAHLPHDSKPPVEIRVLSPLAADAALLEAAEHLAAKLPAAVLAVLGLAAASRAVAEPAGAADAALVLPGVSGTDGLLAGAASDEPPPSLCLLPRRPSSGRRAPRPPVAGGAEDIDHPAARRAPIPAVAAVQALHEDSGAALALALVTAAVAVPPVLVLIAAVVG